MDKFKCKTAEDFKEAIKNKPKGYYRSTPYDFYYVVENNRHVTELVAWNQLRKSDRVLFETISKKQWYDFSAFAESKYSENIAMGGGIDPTHMLKMWNDFNKE